MIIDSARLFHKVGTSGANIAESKRRLTIIAFEESGSY